jgi:hypothetical protein
LRLIPRNPDDLLRAKPYSSTVTVLPAGPEAGVTTQRGFIAKVAALKVRLLWPPPMKMRGA